MIEAANAFMLGCAFGLTAGVIFGYILRDGQ